MDKTRFSMFPIYLPKKIFYIVNCHDELVMAMSNILEIVDDNISTRNEFMPAILAIEEIIQTEQVRTVLTKDVDL